MKIVVILLFAFSISLNLTAQRLDRFNTYELKVIPDKANFEIIAGKILTFTGIGMLVFVESAIFINWLNLIPAYIGFYGAIPTMIVGVVLWMDGDNKKSKAEISLKKFNIVPENSMALGLGITFRF